MRGYVVIRWIGQEPISPRSTPIRDPCAETFGDEVGREVYG
jgi:hypothetical protein